MFILSMLLSCLAATAALAFENHFPEGLTYMSSPSLPEGWYVTRPVQFPLERRFLGIPSSEEMRRHRETLCGLGVELVRKGHPEKAVHGEDVCRRILPAALESQKTYQHRFASRRASRPCEPP